MPPSHTDNPAGPVEVRLNGTVITIHAPIASRPKVFRIVTSDGRQTVLGDHGTFNHNESNELHKPVYSSKTPWKLLLIEGEREELVAAEHDLASARKYVVYTGKLFDESKAVLQKHLESPMPSMESHENHEHYIRRTARTLENKVEQAEEVYREARVLESHALVALNKLKTFLARVALRRSPDYQPSLAHANKKVDSENWRRRLHDAAKEQETES